MGADFAYAFALEEMITEGVKVSAAGTKARSVQVHGEKEKRGKGKGTTAETRVTFALLAPRASALSPHINVV